MIRKILKRIYVVQQKKDTRGYIRNRINPYNPLSYIVLFIALIAGLLMYGFKGLSNEVETFNPFDWQ